MPRAIILQHVPGEGPGRLAHLLTLRGLSLDVRHLYRGDAVPRAGDDALLVIMGGPMGVVDIGDARWPFLLDELELLRRRVARDLPTLGICLGAQLLAHAAGAIVQPNRDAEGQAVLEVGWEPVTFARELPLCRNMRAEEWMLHWHGDTFALPDGAQRLGSTPRCANQGFLLKRRLVGLQFHPEVDAAMVAEWVRDDAAYVAKANGTDGGARILADTQRLLPDHVVVGNRLLGNILDSLLDTACG